MENLDNCNILNTLFDTFQDQPEMCYLYNEFLKTEEENIISFYEKMIPVFESAVWGKSSASDYINLYQSLFREFENHIHIDESEDKRHSIKIIIPVADRPQQLKSCLESIFTLCECYGYGGKSEHYNKISVLIAEDSKNEQCRNRNRDISNEFTKRGLHVSYFGLTEQKKLLSGLTKTQLESIGMLVGDIDNLYHKGASVTRNIVYLKLREVKKEKKTLIYFIDSDQEFCVNQLCSNGEKIFYGINYFYYIDKLFSQYRIDVLTGKVVGDPPVSPSVMASNFLLDVIYFISEMVIVEPDRRCCFHSNSSINVSSDAAYHDMANLFGFNKKMSPFEYQCNIKHKHTNRDCFENFSKKLNQFFDGVHLTRKTYYKHEEVFGSVLPARTIYTGNYVLTVDALQYFIPFASLKLRMAGPTMGRLLKDSIGSRFVSANLPMMHGRIVEADGQSEFRSGIEHESSAISLAGEFERQFFGDVMLFSISKLSEMGVIGDGNLEKLSDVDTVRDVVIKMEIFIREQYLIKLNEINSNLNVLNKIYVSGTNWWNSDDDTDSSNESYLKFIKNISNNFGKDSFAFKLISSNNAESDQVHSIIDAITNYKKNITSWSELFVS